MAFLDYTYGTNGIELPKGKEFAINMIDKDKIKLHIADPAQTQSNITVKIDAPKRSGTINCDLSNSDIYAGRTQTFDIRLK